MTYYPNRKLTRVVEPAAQPLSLSEAKLYLRVDGSSEDALITLLIAAATDAVERYMHKALITQTFKLEFDEQLSGVVALPGGRVQSVSSITLVAHDGDSTELEDDDYYLNSANQLVLDYNLTAARTEIVYIAGYGDAEDVPAPIKLGIAAHIATLYNARETGAAMPAAAIAFYEPFREVRL